MKVYWDCLVKIFGFINATTGLGFGLQNLMHVSHVLTTFLISNHTSFVNSFTLPINFCMVLIFFIWAIFASLSSLFSFKCMFIWYKIWNDIYTIMSISWKIQINFVIKDYSFISNHIYHNLTFFKWLFAQ